jgi:uncharacterized membrane protein YfcA
MLEISQIAICIFAVFLGGMLQGCLGFGFAFIVLPVFAMFFSPLLATPLIVVLSLILNFFIIISCFKHANKKIIGWLIIGGIAGIPVGTMILRHMDASAYSLLAGIVLMCAGVLFLLDKRVPLKDKMTNYIPVGIVSGMLNASLGLSGPPVVLFMDNQAFNKNVMRATMIGYFLIINMSALIWFSLNRLITFDVFCYLRYFVPAVICGTMIGILVSRFIDEKLFRKMILVLVIMIGFVISVKSFCSIN